MTNKSEGLWLMYVNLIHFHFKKLVKALMTKIENTMTFISKEMS